MLQQYVNQELPDIQLGLEKAEEPEIKLLTYVGSLKKTRELQENIYFCFIDYTKAFDCGSQQTVENFQEMGLNTRPPYLPPEKCTQVKKQQLESDMEQLTGSKLGKEYVKATYCHPAYLTYMQSTS